MRFVLQTATGTFAKFWVQTKAQGRCNTAKNLQAFIRCFDWSDFRLYFELEAGNTVLDVCCKDTVLLTVCFNAFCRTTTKFGAVIEGVGADFMSEGLTMLTELFVSGGTLFVDVDCANVLSKPKASVAIPIAKTSLFALRNLLFTFIFIAVWLICRLFYYYFIAWIC